MQKGEGKKLPDGSGVVGRKEWRKIPTHGDAVGRCKNGCFSSQLEQPFLVFFCFSIMFGSLSGESMALLRKKDGSSSEKARLRERKAIGLISCETYPLWGPVSAYFFSSSCLWRGSFLASMMML